MFDNYYRLIEDDGVNWGEGGIGAGKGPEYREIQGL